MRSFFIFLSILFSANVLSEIYTELYGFSLGGSLAEVNKKLGKPDQVIDLEGGSKAYIFIKDKHYVAIATLPNQPDTISSIQLTGEESSKKQGLDGVRLGSKVEKALKKFGMADEVESAVDQVSREKVNNTKIYRYGENFSFEAVNGLVTSIKITYDNVVSSDNPVDKKLESSLPEEVMLVRDYILENDYPEVFKEKTYRISINDFRVLDIGNDGINEVVLATKPHFLQSPTLIIYQVRKDKSVKRVMEALAPGPLVKRKDYFLDSHELGEGVDLKVGEEEFDSESARKLMKTTMDSASFGLLAVYKSYSHMDTRKGAPVFLDMTHLEPFEGSENCSNFEFSAIDGIEVGYKKDTDKTAIIAVLVDSKFYVYEIKSIDRDGFLEKTMKIVSTSK